MLITILTDGIQAYFTDTSMQPENCPPTFHKLIKDQTAIGGRQLFHGGFATEWQRLQNQHLRQNGIQSAIKASLQSAQALAVDTMGCMGNHFEHLTPTAKRPPRS
jgi:hypothetical protein